MKAQYEGDKRRIAIIGAGPSGLFMYKRFVDKADSNFEIEIFERKKVMGSGMPYSPEGANDEHITNVSDNEIPTIVTSIAEWVLTAPAELLARFNIDPLKFNEYKVLPRLFFGYYLSAQFDLLLQQAKKAGITTRVHTGSNIIDIIDKPDLEETWIKLEDKSILKYDSVIVCTGHNWPKHHEGTVPGYYDSPYPPAKLALKINHAVAIRGSSLTAIDAIRTLTRHNGKFEKDSNDKLSFTLNEGSEHFKLVMHSKNGLLPAIRFHLEDSHLSKDSLLTKDQIKEHIKQNDGFLSLDFVFEKDFIEPLKEKDPDFYSRIAGMNIEEFVAAVMALREKLDAFQLFSAEYTEAEKSIKRQESVYWKEALAILSFAMNYPAKYLPAEDMLRLQKVLMPLISIVIAFVPQSSAEQMLALHRAGVLDLIAVGEDSEVIPEAEGGITYKYRNERGNPVSKRYNTFVDCIGQPHLSIAQFPFTSLATDRTVSQARLMFKHKETGRAALQHGNKEVEQFEDNYYLKVPGIAINDSFQAVDSYGAANSRIYIMAVPYIGGYNPDYSGLDFSEAASEQIIMAITAA